MRLYSTRFLIKMLPHTVFVVLLIANSCASEERKHCEENELATCTEQLEEAQGVKKLYQVTLPTDLDAVCTLNSEMMACIDKYVSECLTPSEQVRYRILANGSSNFMRDLCSPNSDLRKDYLQHAQCYKAISGDLDKCADEYEMNQKELEDDDSLSYSALLERTCCIYFENIRCSTNVTTEQCGPAAAGILTRLMTQRGGAYLNEKCARYTSCALKGGAESVKVDDKKLYDVRLSNIIFVIIMQGFTVLIGLNSNEMS